MNEIAEKETLEAFKKSLAYGSRTDLNFKYLAGQPDEAVARFLQGLLHKLMDSLDDGDWSRLIEHVHQGQVRGYAGTGRYTYAEGPFTPLEKPLTETRLALLTSSGHFAAGDDPQPFGVEGMTQTEAVERITDFIKSEPRLTAVPVDTPPDQLRARHGGYDVRGARVDPNVTFPLPLLRQLAEAGYVGTLHPEAYSFVGACAQTRLLRHTGPEWVERFQAQDIEAALLVPV
jgi:D-proline reductase (dithiol) PrdB